MSPWAGRVLNLAQKGNSTGQIVDAIYREELEAGGWMVDIGLWKDRLDSEVQGTVQELVRQGLLGGNNGA